MWYDLTQPLYDGMPHLPIHPRPTFEQLYTVEEHAASVAEFSLATHVGTHIDAPSHFVGGGDAIDDLGVERFAAPGVVVDVPRDEPEAITRADIEDADVRAGDVVLVNTGWGERYGDDDYTPHPWLDKGAADYLVERGVNLLGVDFFSPDLPGELHPEPGWDEFPVHRTLLAEDVLIAENVGPLGAVAGKRLEVMAFPIKIRGGDGAQARFVARD